MTQPIVDSFCDYTGNMVRPWAEDGYDCWCWDIRRNAEIHSACGKGAIHWMPGDVRKLKKRPTAISFAFPPCTNLAVSGARWFRLKGLRGLIDGLELVEACRELVESEERPWMLENPVSTLATYWREPDQTFDPFEYAGYPGGENDLYTKRTCLWTGGGFLMPERKPIVPAPLFGVDVKIDDRIHQMPPGEERGNLRAETPAGFARAVFEANGRAGQFEAGIVGGEELKTVRGAPR